ncbi:MAG: XrtA system polysaccharide deacetylase, partial [Gammaproteobacteria bacterium]
MSSTSTGGSANASSAPGAIVSGMSVDVEDYFQVSALEGSFNREDWDSVPCRVEANMDRVLALFDSHGVKSTFFMLGWVAERYPQMVRRIVDEGHELASHGYQHIRATQQTPDEFRADVSHTKALLEDMSGKAVLGYRAASYSIMKENLWALDVLAETGHVYSSSIFPIHHDLYGIPDASRFPFRHQGDGILEIPMTTVQWMGRRLPAAGGGWFRFYPYPVSRWALNKFMRDENKPAVFYFHPWEVDPAQPRVEGLPAKSRFRHYLNL